MSRYRITSDAQADLIEIHRYTFEQWGEQQSQKYLAELQQAMQRLAETPALGKLRPDVAEQAYSFPCSSHTIYYLQNQDHIIVFGALHKRMVPSNHLADRAVV